MLTQRTLTTLILIASSVLPHAQAAQTAHWSYSGETGPTHWGALSKEYVLCAQGQQQSPIDISNSTEAELAALSFNYQPIPLTIEHNGRTIKVSATKAGQLKIGEDSYPLVQFHTHIPSEVTIY